VQVSHSMKQATMFAAAFAAEVVAVCNVRPKTLGHPDRPSTTDRKPPRRDSASLDHQRCSPNQRIPWLHRANDDARRTLPAAIPKSCVRNAYVPQQFPSVNTGLFSRPEMWHSVADDPLLALR